MRSMIEAALCTFALFKMPPCIEDVVEEDLCRIVCCCQKYPFMTKRKLKQKCADIMMKELRHKEGRPYENGVPYDMDTFKPLEVSWKSGTRVYKLFKTLTDIDGINFPTQRKGRIRIPDVTLYDEKGNLDKLYEIKFPNDRWRKGQKEDYLALVNKNKDRLIELNIDRCNCGKRTEDLNFMSKEEKESIAERFNKYFLGDWDSMVEELFISEVVYRPAVTIYSVQILQQKLAPLFTLPLDNSFIRGGAFTLPKILPRPGFLPLILP